jgi:RNA polymerase sigma factor (sigma-70 family)
MIIVDELTTPANSNLPGERIDEILVRRAKTGDEMAYYELYKRHAQRTAKTIFRITRNVEDTEDAIQDTFTKAFLRLDSFDGRARFSTWLTRIAINSALLVLRKRIRRSELSIDANYEDDSVQTIQVEDPLPNPEATYLRNEEIVRLKIAVQRLPRLLREVTKLRCSDDPPLREIAETIGISVAAAKSRLLRAGIKLRTRLGSSRQGLRASQNNTASQGVTAYESLLLKLADMPTPAGPTQRQIGAELVQITSSRPLLTTSA